MHVLCPQLDESDRICIFPELDKARDEMRVMNVNSHKWEKQAVMESNKSYMSKRLHEHGQQARDAACQNIWADEFETKRKKNPNMTETVVLVSANPRCEAARASMKYERLLQRNTMGERAKTRIKGGIPFNLLSSCFDECDQLSEFRKNVLMKKKENLTRNSDSQSSKNAKSDSNNNPPKFNRRSTSFVRDRALTKIRQVAERGLESQRYKTDLRGFEGGNLTPSQVQYRFRVDFGVNLGKRELQAVMTYFDRDEDGHIDYEEVSHLFFHPEKLKIYQMSGGETGSGKRSETTVADDFKSGMEKVAKMVKAEERREHERLFLEQQMDKDEYERYERKRIRKEMQQSQRPLRSAKAHPLARLFEQFDLDGSGDLTRDEFADALSSLSVGLNPKELRACFIFLDPDNDGEINYAEFATAFFNRRAFIANMKKKAKKRTKPPFLPCNPFEAQTQIAAPISVPVSNKQATLSSDDPGFALSGDKVQHNSLGGKKTTNNRTNFAKSASVPVFLPSSTAQARRTIASRVFLNGQDEALLAAHAEMVKARAALNRTKSNSEF